MIAKGKRIGAFALVICLLLCLLPGCGDEPSRAAYVLPETFESIGSQTIAQNANYRLEWDDEYKSIMMYSRYGKKVWGTTPYEMYAENDTNAYASSPIIIEAMSVTSLSNNVARAYSTCISDGTLSAKKIKNGIEVTYYFDEYSISVPVQYTLRKDSVKISVDTQNITEGDQYLLKTVSLAPYMCAIANVDLHETEEETDDEAEEADDTAADDVADATQEDTQTATTAKDLLKDSYLFAPVGNGALISPALTSEKREYLAEVYGTDGSRYQPYEYYKKESVKMPVFGAKDGDDAILGIMEQGAEQGVLAISAGNKRADYASVAATFYVRGYDIYADEYGTPGATITTRVSKAMANSTLSVGFYPLTGEDANYVGMAERYRDYLLDNGMKKSELEENAYALSVLGNVTTKSLAFGVPYDSAKSMTTFKEAATIIKEMTEATLQRPAVQLLGYGSSGLDIGKVAGGFTFSDVSGSKDDYAALTKLAAKNNISLFTDFDLIYFNSAGNGYSTVSNAAKTATLHKSELYHRMLALRAQDKEKDSYHALNRSKLSDAMQKLLKKGEKLNITGYSFSTLGSVAYSDYAEDEYQIKMNMGADVQEMFASVTEAGHAISTNNANDYAAMVSDTVFNVEVDPRYTNVFDAYVPFYQIVFKGYIPMYSEALNLTADYNVSVLNALSTGVGLGFTVLKNFDTSFAASTQTNLHSSLYSAKKGQITSTVEKYRGYYKAIQGAKISDYAVLDNGVTVTTFDNGVVAYTNPSATAQSYPLGKLPAKGFTYVKGGANE